jgi:hypothetical protein
LAEAFVFSVDNDLYTVPEGFWTDFASVPRLLWSLISPYDLGVGPIPHDFGYRTRQRDRKYWDDVFAACMLKDKISRWRRAAAYQAVRLFGGAFWSSGKSMTTLTAFQAKQLCTLQVSPATARTTFIPAASRLACFSNAVCGVDDDLERRLWWSHCVQLFTEKEN